MRTLQEVSDVCHVGVVSSLLSAEVIVIPPSVRSVLSFWASERVCVSVTDLLRAVAIQNNEWGEIVSEPTVVVEPSLGAVSPRGYWAELLE